MTNLVSTNLSRVGVINPALLGEMKALEILSTEAMINARMAKLVQIWGANDPPNAAQYDVGNLEFDPLKIQAELAAFFEALVRDRVNQNTKAVTLAFAVGTDLDAIASRYPYGVPRKTVAAGTWTGPGTQESDDAYRTRVWLSPSIFSLNGPGQGTFESYVFWALSAPMPADQLPLKHASALTKAGTGEIYVPVMSTTVALPDATAIAAAVAANPNKVVFNFATDPTPTDRQVSAVFAYISEPGAARMGLTDVLNVIPAKVTNVAINAGVTLFPGVDKVSLMTEIAQAVIDLIIAIQWLGADLTLLALDGAFAQAGVYNVVRLSPTADVLVDTTGTVNVTSLTLSYLGTGE